MHKSGVDRARWLAELARALDGARAELVGLAESSPGSEVAALADRIASAICEVAALRRSPKWLNTTAFDPDWTKFRHGRPDQRH